MLRHGTTRCNLTQGHTTGPNLQHPNTMPSPPNLFPNLLTPFVLHPEGLTALWPPPQTGKGSHGAV